MANEFEPGSLAAARVVVYDPVRANMLTTRAILQGVGFRSVEGLTDFTALPARLKDHEIALLIVECGEHVRECSQLLRLLRHGDIPGNPFLPVVATLWQPQSSLVADLLNAGFDDVLIRPFSVAKAQERVKALVQARKPFVVTSDYIGPDRGPQGRDRANADLFDVPNVLRLMVDGDDKTLLRIAEELDAARLSMQKQRLSKLARRIAMAAEVTIQAFGDGSSETAFILDLLDCTDRLVRAARQIDNEEVIDIADVLEGVARRLTNPGPERAENAQLTRQLALALFVAYATDAGDEFHSELEVTLDRVRGRLEKVRARQQRRKDLQSLLTS